MEQAGVDEVAEGKELTAAEELAQAAELADAGPAGLAGAAAAAAAAVDQPEVMPDTGAGAFFDVDNTLMRGASIYYFARGLAARKLFRARDMVKMVAGQMLFRMRGSENADHIDAAKQAALA